MDFTEKNEDLKSFKHEPLGFPPYFTHEFMDLGVPENGVYPQLNQLKREHDDEPIGMNYAMKS